MNRSTLLPTASALALIAMAGGILLHMQTGMRLASPGVKTHPIPGSIRLRADLPEIVLNYHSEAIEDDPVTLGALPPDTSFGQRRYVAPDGFRMDLRVVLMGHDRTSLHKPQICLPGQGWQINDTASGETTIRVLRPAPYDLPVVKLFIKKQVESGSEHQTLAGVYAYWYVADDALSASALGLQRMWYMASRLLRTGVLQRWAYVSCYTPCVPGQEGATFERMKTFISKAAPDFQLYPRGIETAQASGDIVKSQ